MNHFFAILTATQGDTFAGLLSIMLSAMLLGCAVYGLYAVIRLRVTYLLFPNKFLYPGNCKPEECLDEDGFIDYILPRLTVWSILMLIVGILYTLNAYVFFLVSWWIDIATIFVPLIVLGWLMAIQRTAAKRFWGI